MDEHTHIRIKFGKYPQKECTEDGEDIFVNDGKKYLIQPLKWTLLYSDDEYYYFISDIILKPVGSGCKIFCNDMNSKYTSFYDSNARAYLNIEFLDYAFNEEERNLIEPVMRGCTVKTGFRENKTVYCKDKVSLISIHESSSLDIRNRKLVEETNYNYSCDHSVVTRDFDTNVMYGNLITTSGETVGIMWCCWVGFRPYIAFSKNDYCKLKKFEFIYY
ncbi:MAG: DUF6273 domain-containing protein [Acholeplasmatales bacterium]|jgi:hypothetical protein|nr:DUF6273 domain-containing protein [Acholeplasmatales bacterium]